MAFVILQNCANCAKQPLTNNGSVYRVATQLINTEFSPARLHSFHGAGVPGVAGVPRVRGGAVRPAGALPHLQPELSRLPSALPSPRWTHRDGATFIHMRKIDDLSECQHV